MIEQAGVSSDNAAMPFGASANLSVGMASGVTDSPALVLVLAQHQCRDDGDGRSYPSTEAPTQGCLVVVGPDQCCSEELDEMHFPQSCCFRVMLVGLMHRGLRSKFGFEPRHSTKWQLQAC